MRFSPQYRAFANRFPKLPLLPVGHRLYMPASMANSSSQITIRAHVVVGAQIVVGFVRSLGWLWQTIIFGILVNAVVSMSLL